MNLNSNVEEHLSNRLMVTLASQVYYELIKYSITFSTFYYFLICYYSYLIPCLYFDY